MGRGDGVGLVRRRCDASEARDASTAPRDTVITRRYALPWFKALFATGVGRAPASNDMEQRLENLNVFFTYFVYTNVLTQRHMHFDFST